MRLLLALLVVGCDDAVEKPGEDSGTPAEVGPPDCAPDEPSSWDIVGSLSGAEARDAHAVAAPAARGEGVVKATLTFAAFDGSPRLALHADAGGTFPAAITHAGVPGTEEYQTSIFVEWEMVAGDTVELVVDHFLASPEPDQYPLDYALAITWTPVPDCYEDNDTPGEAVEVPPDGVVEAYASGTPLADSSNRDDDEDWYRVRVPEDAAGLSLSLEPPATIIPRLEVYADAGVTVIDAVGAVNIGEPLSLDVEATGEVWVRVFDNFAVEGSWGGPDAPGGVPEPAQLRAPYRLTVASRGR